MPTGTVNQPREMTQDEFDKAVAATCVHTDSMAHYAAGLYLVCGYTQKAAAEETGCSRKTAQHAILRIQHARRVQTGDWQQW